jgi:Cys-tRNA(Pro)/Cys-tRNA(Cys) deacylase
MAARETQATRAARRAGVRFVVHEYAHDPAGGAFGIEAAERLGLAPERVFKTLVADADGTLTVCLVPVAERLDLKALGKRVAMAEPSAAERATGYVVGGISPLGQRTRLPKLLDESALGHDTIFVSAGRRGLEIELAPGDLLALTGGSARRLT